MLSLNGCFTSEAIHHGKIVSYRKSTTEAYLYNDLLYVKGFKEVEILRVEPRRQKEMFIKYDFHNKSEIDYSINSVNSNKSEYEKFRVNGVPVIIYNLDENIYKELYWGPDSVCKYDKIYANNIGNVLLYEGIDTKSVGIILIRNDLSKIYDEYYKECKVSPFKLGNYIPESRRARDYPIFVAKVGGGFVLDLITFPIQYLILSGLPRSR